MPFEIRRTPEGWRLFNLHKREFAKAVFKSKQSAARAGLGYMRYRHEKGKLVGDRLVKVG